METTHDAHLFTHRRAHRRAAWRTRMADELLRYLVVTALLLLLVRPIGVIVALVWGLGIARRYYRGRVGPRLHRRFVRDELRRCGHAACADDLRGRPHRARPEALAEEMGDDPAAGPAVDWARSALAELADTEEAPRPADAALVNVSELVEDVVEVCEARAARDGIEFRLELDAEGEAEADRHRLEAVLLDLVNESVRGLRRGARGPARVTVQMGEDLAGSEVWVRVRDDRRDPADGARGTWGSRPVPGLPGAMLETQASPRNGVEKILTLEKNPERSPVGDGAAAR
ncbi:MAG TPA: hypothetical protein VKB65_14200 [Myxococcota bacterium]|nr:hypothetical protein [Myxococcota bacterium]